MKVLIFDIDNTIIIHTNANNNFYSKNNNSTLSNLLSKMKNKKIYIYTNGTYDHGRLVINNLSMENKIKKIFARDTIPYMKPYNQSFEYVNNTIIKENKTIDQIIFFDDLKENLYTAKKFNWTTVLIGIDNKKEPYIDYTFPNIYESIIFFNRIQPNYNK